MARRNGLPPKGTVLGTTKCQDCERPVNVLQSGGRFAYYTCQEPTCMGHHKFSAAVSKRYQAAWSDEAPEPAPEPKKTPSPEPKKKGGDDDWFGDL